MGSCQICGADDLYTACSDEGVCSTCKIKFIFGMTATKERIAEVRKTLGLADGELLKQDNAEEARRILGR